MKLFTKNALGEFFPFLMLCFFFFVALRYHDLRGEKTIKIIMGVLVCVLMSIMGIIFSDLYPIPFLIKISPQRSSGLITVFAVLYIAYYLYKKIESGNILASFIAVYCLLVMVFSKPGITILPLFVLVYLDIRDGQFGFFKLGVTDRRRLILLFHFIVFPALGFLFAISLMAQNILVLSSFPFINNIYQNLWTPLQYFNPFNGFDFLLKGGSFRIACLIGGSSLITCAIIIFKMVNKRSLEILSIIILVIMSLSIVWYAERNQYLSWYNRYYKIASSYLDVQLWAKKNTLQHSLFMPDPTHHYGWRDFSERSSFGNLREWGYCAIAYNPTYKVYREGIRRMREFGIDIDIINEKDVRNPESYIYGQKLTRYLGITYYDMKAERLRALSEKYKIDYLIMEKRRQKYQFKQFTVVYENEHYIVYRV
jgi:hypothetical protein